MGAYLSEPIVEKLSSDEISEFLNVGSSSMQGWRKNQEDAHNCILKFDDLTSFFAVYDGHGGAEVATYCADMFPAFFKELDSYKTKEFEKALKDAFLGFDAKLLEENVIEILKKLAGEQNADQESEIADEEEDEDLDELCQEGALPLNEVLEKYKEAGKLPQVKKLINDDPEAGGSGAAKPLSPFLRGRKDALFPASSTNNVEEAAGSSTGPEGSSKIHTTDDSTVSSSSSGKKLNETKTSAVLENGSVKESCSSPDSSESKEAAIQNGSVTSCKDAKTEGVSSSAASAADSSPVGKGNAKNGVGLPGGCKSPASTRSASKGGSPSYTGISSSTSAKVEAPAPSDANDDDDSSSDSDDDFHSDENSSTDECGDSELEDDDGEEEEDEGSLEDDAFCANMAEEPGKDSGCTAVVALLVGRDLYVANAGDSRCVVCRNGKAIEMSLDHKPEDDEESLRILKAGGRVTLDGRVNGGLNLSRAIGDHAYKMNKCLPAEQQMISAQPDVKKLIISPDDEFMVLACDGIWNFMSSDEVVEFIKNRIDQGKKKMSEICEELFENCLAPNTMGDGTGCDNMTAIIVNFNSKILELPTTLNVDETESEFLAKPKAAGDGTPKKATAAAAAAASASANDDDDVEMKEPQKSNKRSASPTSQETTSEADQSKKRLKTDDEGGLSSTDNSATPTTTT